MRYLLVFNIILTAFYGCAQKKLPKTTVEQVVDALKTSINQRSFEAILFSLFLFCFCSPKPEEEPKPKELFTQYKRTKLLYDGGLSRGAGWGDMNQDGYPDLYVTNSRGQWNFLYQNMGEGNMQKLTEGQNGNFAESIVHGGSSEGVNWVDYDNDGDLDIYISSRGIEANHLFKNDSLKRFIKVEDHPLTKDDISSSMACWADIDGDGDLDVLLVGYRYNGNYVFENLGDGNFERKDNHLLSSGEGLARNCSLRRCQ